MPGSIKITCIWCSGHGFIAGEGGDQPCFYCGGAKQWKQESRGALAPARTALRWSFANPKMGKLNSVSFGIPAYRSKTGFVTCPNAGACAAVCYARQGKYVIMPTVRESRETNLAWLRSHTMEEFVAAAVQDLSLIKAGIVRVHDSGDFFCQEYLEAWYEIARRVEKTFYAYTKCFHLDLWSKRPENFKLVQSEGGIHDEMIDFSKSHARIFSSHEVRETAGYRDGSRNDALAIEGALKIGLVYHGRRPLTPAQKEQFV